MKVKGQPRLYRDHNLKFMIHNSGFTLLELLIVISIIGILVAVGLASYATAQRKARDARRQQDVRSIQAAAEQFFADNNAVYPQSNAGFGTFLPAGWPVGPRGAANNDTYTYSTNGTFTTYCVCAIGLEDTNNANAVGQDGTNVGQCVFTGTRTQFCLQNSQ